jgi:hypothetical protein
VCAASPSLLLRVLWLTPDRHSKNKVLKIYGTLLVVQAEVAKAGGKASASQQSQLDDLNSKLAANVKLDQQAKGKASTNVSFNC